MIYYEGTNKSHKIAIIICIVLAILSPHWFAKESKENKTIVYQTGSEIKKTESSSWTVQKAEEARSCDQKCKVETLVKLGITSKLSNLIVSECKEWAIDPVHCIKVASTIMINESGGGKSNACVKRFNCFGIWSWKVVYTSYEEAVTNWVSKYNRYWFKAKDMSFFYAQRWDIPPSRYCMSEDSSDTSVGCPSGLRITTNIFNKLNQLF